MPTTHSKASKPAPGTAKQSVEQPPAANTRSRARQAAAKATAKSTDAKAFEAIDLQSLTPDQGTRIVRQRERRRSAPKSRAATAADADTGLVEAATIAHAADDGTTEALGDGRGDTVTVGDSIKPNVLCPALNLTKTKSGDPPSCTRKGPTAPPAPLDHTHAGLCDTPAPPRPSCDARDASGAGIEVSTGLREVEGARSHPGDASRGTRRLHQGPKPSDLGSLPGGLSFCAPL